MTENRTVWKSDNQGVKDETFIQTGGRGREDLQQGGGWWTQRGGRLWSRAGKAAAGGPGDRPCDPQFQHRETKPQTTD